jgi:tRNA-splicing ligase RtcB
MSNIKGLRGARTQDARADAALHDGRQRGEGWLCADGHLGYAHPIGGVVAYEEDNSISGIGFDIACGNMAVRLDVHYFDIVPRAKTILNDIGREISFGVRQHNAVKVDHELFDSPLWDAPGVANLKEMARNQLSTAMSISSRMRLVWYGSVCTSARAASDTKLRPSIWN